MSAQWKAGDVAMVASHLDGGRVVAAIRGDRCWIGADAEGRRLTMYDDPDRTVRPVVVIDPEDTEQVKRLEDLLWATNDEQTASNDMAAALREFASPTPPPCDQRLRLGSATAQCDLEEAHASWHMSHGMGVSWA